MKDLLIKILAILPYLLDLLQQIHDEFFSEPDPTPEKPSITTMQDLIDKKRAQESSGQAPVIFPSGGPKSFELDENPETYVKEVTTDGKSFGSAGS